MVDVYKSLRAELSGKWDIDQSTGHVRIYGSGENGSIRFNIDPVNDNVIIEKKVDGVWSSADLMLTKNSFYLNYGLNLSAAGDHVTAKIAENNHVFAYRKFTDTGVSESTKVLNLYDKRNIQVSNSDSSVEWSGTNISYSFLVDKDCMVSREHYKTGSLAATDSVTISIYKEFIADSDLIHRTEKPASQFPSNSDIAIDIEGLVEYKEGDTIIIQMTSNSNFSLLGSLGNQPYRAWSGWYTRQDALIATTQWVAGTNYTENQWLINADEQKIYVCNTTGVQTGTWENNIDKWDPLSGDRVTNRSQRTGLLSGGVLSGDSTTLSWSSGSGQIVDFTDPLNPNKTDIKWNSVSNYNPGVVDDALYFIGYDSSSTIQIYKASETTPSIQNELVIFGSFLYSAGSIILVDPLASNIGYYGSSSIHDFATYATGPYNTKGNKYSPNGINLKIDVSEGEIFIPASNFRSDSNNPNLINLPAATATTFRYLGSGVPAATEVSYVNLNASDIDPNQYDKKDGTLGSVTEGYWTLQHIFRFKNGTTAVCYGQTQYSTKQLAIANSDNDGFIIRSPLFYAAHRSVLAVRQGCTDLSDSSQAVFLTKPAAKWYGAFSKEVPVVPVQGFYVSDGDIPPGDVRTIKAESGAGLSVDAYDLTASTYGRRTVVTTTGDEHSIVYHDGDGEGNTLNTRSVSVGRLGMVVEDSISSKGMVYAADYSENYTDRSLVDKAYVDNSKGSGSIYETDGVLTASRLLVARDAKTLTFDLYDTTESDYTNRGQLTLSPSSMGMTWGVGDGAGNDLSVKSIVLTDATMLVTDTKNQKGLQYAADYSGKYTDRSLVDKGYVTTYFSEIVGTFSGLSDTPSDYTGSAGKLVLVNDTPEGPDGIEFSNSIVWNSVNSSLEVTGNISASNQLYKGTVSVPNQSEIYNYTTGWLDGGVLSINGGDNTLIDISEGSVFITDFTDQLNPSLNVISWTNQTGLDPALVGRSLWVGVQNNAGSAQFVYDSDFNSVERRSIAVLGRIWNSGGSGPVITNVAGYERPAWGLTTAFQDFVLEYGSWNIFGNEFSANGPNLLLDKASGRSYRYNASNIVGSENVHIDAELIGISSYNYHVQGSDSTSVLSAIDPDNYDNGGVLTSVPPQNWTIQEIWFFPVSGTTHIVYGQATYNSYSDAILHLSTESKVRNTDILNGAILRNYLIVKAGATDLSSTFDAVFQNATGAGAGAGGSGITEFSDDQFKIFNVTDTSKQIQFDVGLLSASTIRTITVPDRDIVLGTLASDPAPVLAGNLDGGGNAISNITTLSTSGDVTIGGQLVVQGDTFKSFSETVEVKDNLLVINSGELGAGVTAGSAGIQVDRGTETDYQFLFVEADDNFQIGQIGSLQPVATREATPTDNLVPYWDAATLSFKNTDSPITIDGTKVGIGVVPTQKFESSGPVVSRGSLTASQTNAAVMSISGDECRLRAYGATAGSGYWTFRVGGGGGSVDSEGMRLNTTGLGLGTVIPVAKIHTVGSAVIPPLKVETPDNGIIYKTTIGTNKRIQTFYYDNTDTLIGRIGTDISGDNTASIQMVAGSGSTPQFTLNSNGLGINESSPAYKLTVRDDSSNAFPLALTNNNIGLVGTEIGILFGFTGTTYQKGAIIYESLDAAGRGKFHLALHAGNNSSNVTKADSRVTVDYLGNLGVGTTSPNFIGDFGGTTGIGVSSTGVDGTYADILTGYYSFNSNEQNAIQTTVSSVAGNSGFRFMISNGGGVTTQTVGYKMTRADHNFYIGGSTGMLLTSTGLSVNAQIDVQAGVNGQAGVFNSTNANGVYATFQTSGTPIGDIGSAKQIFGSGSISDFGINSRAGKDLVLGAENVERARLTAGGITFKGDSGIYAYFQDVTEGNTPSRVGVDATGNLLIQGYDSASNETIRLYSNTGNPSWITSGNFGIGIDTPQEIVHVQKDGTTAYSTLTVRNTNSTAVLNFGVGGSAVTNTPLQNNAYLINSQASSLILGTNDTARLTIDSSGNVGFGTSSPSTIGHFKETTSNAFVTIESDAANSFAAVTTTNDSASWTFGTDSDDKFSIGSGTDLTTELFSIKSSGVVNISSLPTSAAGLSTGDLFTQTAAELGGTGTTKVLCAA